MCKCGAKTYDGHLAKVAAGYPAHCSKVAPRATGK